MRVSPPFAHHIDSQGRVGYLHADIDRPREPVKAVEILGERLPVPWQTFGQGRTGNILDPFQQPDQPVVTVRAGRREPDAAVPHDYGGNAMLRGRGQLRVPGSLPVEVGVGVDKTWRHDQPVGIDLTRCPACHLPDVGDLAVLDRHIAGKRRGTGPVDD